MFFVGLDPAADLETIHFRHHHIEKTKVDLLCPDLLQRLRAIYGQ